MVRHRVEVNIGEVQTFFGTVVNVLTRQVPVQVHLPQTDRVAHIVTAFDRRHGTNIGLVGNCGKRTNSGFDGFP